MKENFLDRAFILFVVLALIVTGCGAPAPATGAPATEAPAETAAPPTRIPPPRMPPAGVETPTPEAPTAAPVASSNVDACKLPGRTPANAFDWNLLGVPRASGYAPSTGTVEVAVLFVDYSDARATGNPEDEVTVLDLSRAGEYFREVSYGRLDVVFKPHATWLNLPQPAAYYRDMLQGAPDETTRDLMQEIVALAGSSADFSDTDILLVISNPQAVDAQNLNHFFSSADSAGAIQAGSGSIPSGIFLGNVRDTDPVAQETLRNNIIARYLAYLMTAVRHGYRDETMFPGLTGEQRQAAAGGFSILSNTLDTANAPGMFAYERWHFGWLDDGQIFCQTEGEQTTEVSAIEQEGGTKAVMVPLGPQCALVVESRRATGVDQKLVKEGALVYTVDTSMGRNQAPIRVLPLPLPTPIDDLMRDQAPLAEGESLTYGNVTVTNVTKGENGDTVHVAIASGQSGCSPDVTSLPVQTVTPNALAGLPASTAACSLGTVPDPAQSDAMLRFVNESGFEGVGYWQDTSQTPPQELQYFNVPNNGQFDQETQRDYKWIVKEPGGATLLEYSASREKKQCVLIKRALGTLWVDFVNQSGVPAIGYVMDANGKLEEYFRVSVGGTTGLWTANGVAWRILDGNGNVLLDYTSTSAANQHVVIPPLTATPTSPAPANTKPPANTPVPTSTAGTPILIDPVTNCPQIPGATKVTCYDVIGTTESELRAYMTQSGPRDPFDGNKPVDGYTAWFVAWNWPGYGTNQCDLSSATVTLTKVEVTMPRWSPPANASPALVAKWNRYIQALGAHEKVHVDNIVNNYLSVKTAIQNATCSTAEAAAQRALESLREFDKTYDRQTDHGRTEGAVFP